MQTAAAAATGATVNDRPRAPRPRTLRLATIASAVVHGGLLAAALAIPTSRMLDDDRVTVDIVDPAVAPPPPAAESPPPRPQLVRAVMVKKARPIEAPAAAPAPPPPLEEPAAEPSPPVARAPTTETTQDPRAVAVAAAPAGAGISGGGPGVPSGRGPVGGGAPTESQRRGLADGYRDELLRTRIRDHFRYPAEALELELIGRVVIQVTVDRNGRLLAARVAGSCPHQLLCEDGLRTVRAAAPFPALPADLGDTLRIEIPLKYDFH